VPLARRTSDRVCLEPCVTVDDLRPRVVRVLVAVRRQGAQGLELADRAQPGAYMHAMNAPPALNRPGKVRPPEERGGHRSEELVVLPVMKLHEPVQPGDGSGRRQGACMKLVLQRGEPRGSETLALETRQHVRQDIQVAGRPLGGVKRLTDACAQRNGKHRLNHDDRHERTKVAGDRRVGGRDEGHRGEGRGDATQPSMPEQYASFRPRHQRVALHCRPHVGSSQRQRLAQVQRVCELGDRVLARLDLSAGSGTLQPCRERLFARAGARNRQQLEQRTGTEEIQVVRVQMPVVSKAVAGLAPADPSVLDPRKSPLVEADGTNDAGQRPNDPVVALYQHQKDD
jgi:hypothetical protein